MDNTESHDRLESLWAEYHATGDIGPRLQLTLQYAPLAKYVAGQAGATVETTATALHALVGAIDEYDAGGDGSFETFALQRMADALGDRCLDEYDVPAW